MPEWLQSRTDGWRHHAAASVVLAFWILLRWGSYLTSPGALGDETIYLLAFRAVSEGHAPQNVGGFYYPDTFAVLGSWLLRALGEAGTLAVLRSASVVGLVVTVWVSACLLPLTWIGRLALAALYVAVAPAVYYGLEIGNVTFVVSGAIVLGLLAWPARAVLSGSVLGASVAVKPLAPLAIAALLAHRPLPPSRKQWLAGGTAGLIALALLLLSPGYLETPAGAIDRLPFLRSISLNRILVLLGLDVPPLAVAAVLAVVVVGVARRVAMDRDEILAFGGLAAVLAVPVIWSHTLLLTLPLQGLAIARATHRRLSRAVGEGDRRGPWRRYELVFVLLAAAALQLTEGAGAIDDQSRWFQLVVLGGAYAAAPVLMAYVLLARSPRVVAARQEPTARTQSGRASDLVGG